MVSFNSWIWVARTQLYPPQRFGVSSHRRSAELRKPNSFDMKFWQVSHWHSRVYLASVSFRQKSEFGNRRRFQTCNSTSLRALASYGLDTSFSRTLGDLDGPDRLRRFTPVCNSGHTWSAPRTRSCEVNNGQWNSDSTAVVVVLRLSAPISSVPICSQTQAPGVRISAAFFQVRPVP
jgi:hypothetical protein